MADSIRKLYPAGKVIYGLNVPQFMELARKYTKDLNLGLTLWEDKGCRESRLFSLYLIPTKELGKDKAIAMIKNVESVEEAEFLAFRILRHLPYANQLYDEISKEYFSSSIISHCITMFKKNLDLTQ